MKKIFKLITVIVSMFLLVNDVGALQTSFTENFIGFAIDYDNELNQIVMKNSDYLPGGTDFSTHFKISSSVVGESTSYAEGRVLYCADGNRNSPNLESGSAPFNRDCYIRTSEESNYKSIAYIYENGYGTHKTSYSSSTYLTGDYKKDYLITQVALWYFTSAPEWMNNFDFDNGTFNGESNDVTQKISKLIKDAEAASAGASLDLSLSDTKMSLTSDGKYYISKEIKVTGKYLNSSITATTSGVSGAFVTTDQNATSGGTTFNNNSTLYIKVPSANITSSSTITLKASATTSLSNSEAIECKHKTDDEIQPVIIYYPKNTEVSDSISVNISNFSVKIIKKDTSTGNNLEGATLVVKNSNGGTVSTVTSGSEAKNVSLIPGTYTLEETIAPKGYIKNTNKIEFTVNSDGKVFVNNKEVTEVTMTNDPIIVTISKKDVAGSEEIPGAKLKITTEDGKTAKDIDGNDLEWTSTNEPKEFHLAAGTYILSETVAPEGYIKSESKIEFVVDEEGKVTVGGKEVNEVVITNKLITITISKRSITGSKEIAGAKLKITDKNGNIVKDSEGELLEWTSIATPRRFHLAAGTYILSEIVAPEGYELSETTIEFTVTDDGKVLIDGKEVKDNLIIFTNTPEPEQVPTGNIGIYVIVALGVVSIGAAVAAYFIIKKRRK